MAAERLGGDLVSVGSIRIEPLDRNRPDGLSPESDCFGGRHESGRIAGLMLRHGHGFAGRGEECVLGTECGAETLRGETGF